MKHKGFTLIELLVVIAIIAILAAVINVILNPLELLKRGRDATRLTDLKNLNDAINTDLADGLAAGASKLSILCQGLMTPTCSGASTDNGGQSRAIDGTGWVKVNMNSSKAVSFATLPVDPSNPGQGGTATYHYFYYSDGNNWEVATKLESSQYQSKMSPSTGLYAVGTDLTLISSNSFLASTGASPSPSPSSSPTAAPTATPVADVTVTVDKNTPDVISKMSMAVDHTQDSFDHTGGDATSIASAKSLLQASTVYQLAPIMGWGDDNPEPSQGSFNWGTLDARINMIQSTGGIPIITLCCAPDWMYGGTPGTTNWANLGMAPTIANYPNFAILAKTAAQRYPQVTRYLVWNEMKGFWNGAANRWAFEDYTNMYNQVYDALKSVNASIQVGGPYVIMNADPTKIGSSAFGNPTLTGSFGNVDPRSLDVVTYWLANKHGADFITYDGSNGTPGFQQNQDYFTVVDNWVASKTTLPMWWAEWYSWGPSGSTIQESSAAMASGLIWTLRSGAVAPLVWGPQGVDLSGTSFPVGIWTTTTQTGGGQATPLYPVFTSFKNNFGPGIQTYKTTVSVPASVDALASLQKTILVNKTASQKIVNLNGTFVTLTPYQISTVSTP